MTSVLTNKMELVKIINVCQIKFKDGRIFYIPENQMEAFAQTREKNSLVKIEGDFYDKFLVEEISRKKIDENFLKLSVDQRAMLESYVQRYYKGLRKYPSDYTKSIWAQKIQNGERISLNF